MYSFVRLIKGVRKPKKKRNRKKALMNNPQCDGICVRIYTTTPKKPNSGIRKVAKVALMKTRRKIIAHIPGIGHNLHQYSHVRVRGGRVRDIPGVQYRIIRGLRDCAPVGGRRRRRSFYGLKKKSVFF